jgi:hypothetical protein
MPLDFLNKLKKPSVAASSMVSITENGHKAVDGDMETGDGFAVLSILDEHSPMSVSGIARTSRVDVFRTGKIVEKLRNQGKVSVSEYSDE